MNPLISVIIPLFNKEPHILRSINSVLKQTFQKFEIVIIDDGSTDNGPEMVKKINDSRIKLIQQINSGVSVARNRGIQNINTDFITFLDADDEWTPNHLQILFNLQKTYPGAGAYVTSYSRCNSKGIIRKMNNKYIEKYPWEGIIPDYFRAATEEDPPVCSSSVGIPKYVFSEIGMFLEGEPMGEDLDMWGRIAIKYSIAFSWRGESKVYVDAVNRSGLTKVLNPNLPFINSGKKAIERGEVHETMINEVSEYISYLQLGIAYHFLLRDDSDSAAKILKECKTNTYKIQKNLLFLFSRLPIISFKIFRGINKLILWCWNKECN
ncbi:glycosyltransferase family 2 protein [Methanospirillum lacunae]|uniref:Glycosyltransferase family 2 protein n=1 Tax=Methanospirillum lacunae TaxID=668570 RepID=A0A2V2N8D3_9EURY|nr:glycosyltransferase family 2 protein [Methanospirillum lacunae]PWR72768.1 glycosyltransferase family 2 protein [Methanospirillum lacunae]